MKGGDGATTTAMAAGPPTFTTRLRAGVDAVAARLPLWPTLAIVSLVTLLVQIPAPHASAWHWFDDAGGLLLGDGPSGSAGGLHLYRDNPDFQFGPLSIAVAIPFTLLGTQLGPWAAMIVASVAGLVVLALLLDAAERLRPGLRRQVPPSALLAGGVAVVVTWGDVAVRTAHIDDAIALVAVAAALRWCAQAVSGSPGNGQSPVGRGAAVTVALAIAAAAKPWALMFAPLAAVPPTRPRHGPPGRAVSPARSDYQADDVAGPSPAWLGRMGVGRTVGGQRSGAVPAALARVDWARLTRVGVVGAVALLTWAPFILAEPQTLDTADYGIANEPTSVLRALGVDDPTTPGWARPAQLLGGTALVGWLVVRGRWPVALLAGVAWRLLLDPAANRYYTIGFVLGALLVELWLRRGRLPWATLAAAVALELTAIPGIPVVPGRLLRLATVALTLALVLVWSLRRPSAAGSSTLPTAQRNLTLRS